MAVVEVRSGAVVDQVRCVVRPPLVRNDTPEDYFHDRPLELGSGEFVDLTAVLDEKFEPKPIHVIDYTGGEVIAG